MAAEPTARPCVLHLHLDQFIAAVEVLRRPELTGVPLIVGGRPDPTERAVVSTASPDAVILPVDAPAYEADVLRGVDGSDASALLIGVG